MNAKQRDQFIRNGKRAPVISILEQARVHISLAETHQAPLARFGWPAENTTLLSERVRDLDRLYSARAHNMDISKNAARNEQLAIDEAKGFITNIRTAVPLVLNTTPTPEVTEDAFKIRDSLGRSANKHIKYLMRTRPFVEALEERFTPFFGGESPLTQLDAIKAEIEASDALQETLRGTLPAGTRKIVELNGEIFEMIDNLNRVARLAFQDSPEIARQFNRNLIERGRRSVRKAEGGEVVVVSEEAGAPGDASGSLGEVVTDLAV